MDGPERVAKKFAGEKYRVGLAGADDGVGLLRGCDHADGTSGQTGLSPNLCCEGDLVAGAEGDLLQRAVSAGGAIEQINPVGGQFAGESDGVVDRPAAFDPVAGGHAEEERPGPFGAHRGDDFEKRDAAIGVAVRPVVRQGREERVQEIAVGGVDFDEFEAGGFGAAGGGDVGVEESRDLVNG